MKIYAETFTVLLNKHIVNKKLLSKGAVRLADSNINTAKIHTMENRNAHRK